MKLFHHFIILTVLLAWSCDQRAVPFEEGYVQSLGDSIYYKVVGQGEPLLIVHGGPVLDHQYLYEHFIPLSSQYRLIFYDQRACGKSQLELEPDHMTFQALIEDIDVIRNDLGYDRINVLGHSWGGLLAMQYAIQFGEKVDHLILSNSMAPSAEDWNQENTTIASRYSTEDRDQLDKLSSSGLLRAKDSAPYIEQMMMISYKTQFYDTSKMDQLKLYITNDYQLRSATFMQLASEISNYDLYKELEQIRANTLIIYGENEPATELYINKFEAAFPSASSAVINGSGHFPFIENPYDYFDTIEHFLFK